MAFKAGETEVLNIESAGSWRETTSQPFTIEEAAELTFVGGSGTGGSLDYIVLQSEDGTINGREYVDLGLPSGTLWATCNVGASSPEDYGDYFAWGETAGYNDGKTDFYWSTYKWCEGSSSTMTKYCTKSTHGYNGFTDNKTELDLEDDAAYVNWGPAWRMPSNEQFAELINSSYTTTTWTTQNGVYGRLITSKSNGNSIFLPAAGEHYNSKLTNAGSNGNYWSRTLHEIVPDAARLLYFYSGYINSTGSDRYYGRSVRPVRFSDSQSPKVSSISLNQTSLSVNSGATEQLTATISPSDAVVSIIWTSSDESVATVDENGLVTGVAAGTCTITATVSGTDKTATCTVTVVNAVEQHEYVDLGLPSRTLWATCNVGASTPEDYGDYFAWGETAGYNDGKTNFNWSTYKWCEGSSSTMTKYCTDSSYGYHGFTDNKTELDLENDAAYVNWGAAWRMPSIEQFAELINSSYTTTTWTTQNGVNGRLITSKSNDNSIFLPAAGNRDNSSLSYAGSHGNYWSRSLYESAPFAARYLDFGSGGVDTYGGSSRRFGQSVRPVRFSE